MKNFRPFSALKVPAVFVTIIAASAANAAIPPGYTGTPFSYDTLKGHPQQIPGVIKCAFFDNGGEGVAFHESSNNKDQQGDGSMRRDFSGTVIQADWPVDMQKFSLCRDHEENGAQSDTGSWFLGWTFPPEWQKHTVHVNTAGTYYVTFHMAESDSPNIVGLTFYNGTSVQSDSVKNLRKSIIPSTCCGGGCEYWHAWGTFSNVDSIALDTGLQVFQISYIMGNWNFDKIIFTLKGGTGTQAPAAARRARGLIINLKAVLSGDRLAVFYRPIASGASRVSIVDCTGKTVLSSIGLGGTADMNVQRLRQGVYLVKVEQAGLREVKSFVITH